MNFSKKLGSADINLVRDGQKPKKNLTLTNDTNDCAVTTILTISLLRLRFVNLFI